MLLLTLLTLFACKPSSAGALAGDVIAVCSVLTLTNIGTVFPIKSSWATFQESE